MPIWLRHYNWNVALFYSSDFRNEFYEIYGHPYEYWYEYYYVSNDDDGWHSSSDYYHYQHPGLYYLQYYDNWHNYQYYEYYKEVDEEVNKTSDIR